jgi:hypothetical protein
MEHCDDEEPAHASRHGSGASVAIR